MTVLGLDCKLYRNTGTYAVPVWSEVESVKDLTLGLSKGEADASTRGNGGWEASRGTLKTAQVDFNIVWSAGDDDFTAIRDAFLNNTEVEFAVMDGDITTTGNQGLRALFSVNNFTRNENLTDVVTVDVGMKPSLSTDAAPAWMTVA